MDTLRPIIARTHRVALLAVMITMAVAYWLLSSGEARWDAETITEFRNVRGEALQFAAAAVKNEDYISALALLPMARSVFGSEDTKLLADRIRNQVRVEIVGRSIVVKVSGHGREATSQLASLVMNDVMDHMQPRPGLVQLRKELEAFQSGRLAPAGENQDRTFLLNMAKKEALVEYYRRRLAIYDNYLSGHEAGAMLARLDYNAALQMLALEYENDRLHRIYGEQDLSFLELNRLRLSEIVRLLDANRDKLAGLVEMEVVRRQPPVARQDTTSIWYKVLLWGLFTLMLWFIGMTLFALRRENGEG